MASGYQYISETQFIDVTPGTIFAVDIDASIPAKLYSLNCPSENTDYANLLDISSSVTTSLLTPTGKKILN